ncbi:hypothetical protein OHB01_34220 [Microbispora hainanensis]|nr:hypothetical protein [Microbispora hainanensis]
MRPHPGAASPRHGLALVRRAGSQSEQDAAEGAALGEEALRLGGLLQREDLRHLRVELALRDQVEQAALAALTCSGVNRAKRNPWMWAFFQIRPVTLISARIPAA